MQNIVNKEYRIEWMGWYGQHGYALQVRKRWWRFKWWETIDIYMRYEEAEEEYKRLTS